METKKVENNEYTICFRNIFFVMKMLVVFPFYPLHEVFNISSALSSTFTIISLSMFAWVNFVEQINLLHLFLELLRNFTFLSLVGFLPHAFMKFLLILVPCLTWNKTKQLRNYRNNWKRFELGMEKLSGTPFKCLEKNKIERIFVGGMICVSSFCALMRIPVIVYNKPSTTKNTFSVFYMVNGVSNLMMYWVANNVYTTSSAKKITDLVRQTIKKERYADLHRLIDSWIMLCDLNEEFISSHSLLFLIFFSIIIILVVIGVYSTVFTFIYRVDKTMSIQYFCGTIICTLSLITFCESANSVTNNMVYKLRRTLLSESVNKKNRQLLQMVHLFLQTIETKDPQITFNRYMKVNRATVTLVLGASIYFLVVLKQFSPV